MVLVPIVVKGVVWGAAVIIGLAAGVVGVGFVVGDVTLCCGHVMGMCHVRHIKGFTLPHASWWTPCTLSGVYKESTGTAVGLHKKSMNTIHRKDSDGHSL
jgi:hypothetical protein